MSTKKIWTNGCYDILHVGHIALFEYAKFLGDQLIVGIDSDKRVKKLKGEDICRAPAGALQISLCDCFRYH